MTALVRVTACGTCGGSSGTGAGFLQVLGFPLPMIPPTALHTSSSITRGWYSGPNSADAPSELNFTQPQEAKGTPTLLGPVIGVSFSKGGRHTIGFSDWGLALSKGEGDTCSVGTTCPLIELALSKEGRHLLCWVQ
jgi:hypothetical protein